MEEDKKLKKNIYHILLIADQSLSLSLFRHVKDDLLAITPFFTIHRTILIRKIIGEIEERYSVRAASYIYIYIYISDISARYIHIYISLDRSVGLSRGRFSCSLFLAPSISCSCISRAFVFAAEATFVVCENNTHRAPRVVSVGG